MAKDAKIDYDYENDILYLISGENVKDSLQVENFVIDFSDDDKVVGVEVLDASRILSQLTQLDITKEALSKAASARISVYQGREIMYVLLFMCLPVNQESVDVRIPIPAPVAVSATA